MKKLLFVTGTRPNFIKLTQFPRALAAFGDQFDYQIVHTGQHYDDKMSKVFFEQFGLMPDRFLDAGGASANTQMADIMLGLEQVIDEYQPDLILVPGDVNSTLAAALTARKMGVKLAHIESGLRSFDRSMPEEVNRIITDELADLCFVTEQSGMENLRKEGKAGDAVFFVGNTMIDTLLAFDQQIEASPILEKQGLSSSGFILMTMHRPATVDSKEGMMKLLELLGSLSGRCKILFPLHPRTLKNAEKFGLLNRFKVLPNLLLTEPMDYFSFQKLLHNCKMVITDSGGIQEETTFRKVPCLTLRENTERPSTVTMGTNELMSFDIDEINKKIDEIENGSYKKGEIPPLWDGKATDRIVEQLIEVL